METSAEEYPRSMEKEAGISIHLTIYKGDYRQNMICPEDNSTIDVQPTQRQPRWKT
jgi:hypothetical protein